MNISKRVNKVLMSQRSRKSNNIYSSYDNPSDINEAHSSEIPEETGRRKKRQNKLFQNYYTKETTIADAYTERMNSTARKEAPSSRRRGGEISPQVVVSHRLDTTEGQRILLEKVREEGPKSSARGDSGGRLRHGSPHQDQLRTKHFGEGRSRATKPSTTSRLRKSYLQLNEKLFGSNELSSLAGMFNGILRNIDGVITRIDNRAHKGKENSELGG